MNLSYCTLVAPMEGMVSRKAIEVGQRVQPGQALMALLPLHKVYIEANYKETQLTQVRVGQPVEIRADVYPDHVYHGTVESLSGGTGAAFSLLPPENATGNWVKVVQRLPVKITLSEPPPPDLPLRVGLSVEASIDISNHDGSRLSSLLQEQGQKEGTPGDARAWELTDLTIAPTKVAHVGTIRASWNRRRQPTAPHAPAANKWLIAVAVMLATDLGGLGYDHCQCGVGSYPRQPLSRGR